MFLSGPSRKMRWPFFAKTAMPPFRENCDGFHAARILGNAQCYGTLIICGFRDGMFIRTRTVPIRHPGSIGTYVARPCATFSGCSLNPDDWRFLRIRMSQCILAAFTHLVFREGRGSPTKCVLKIGRKLLWVDEIWTEMRM